MEGKRESFFKRYELLLLLLLTGVLLLVVTKRWDLYAKPAATLSAKLERFLGIELPAWTSFGYEKQEIGFGDDDGQEYDPDEFVDEFDVDGQDDDLPDPQGGDGEAPGIGEGQDGQAVQDGSAAPVWQTVDETYFDDALFIGDSRVVGLRDYGKLEEHGTFYAYEGLNIFRLLSAKFVQLPGQRKKISVEEALGQQQFGKIYLMVGINELDIGTTERFRDTYQETIDRIRELQPNAKIIIQSIMLVTQKRSSKGDFVKNSSIMERNEAIAQLADGVNVFYLDVNEAIVDESGGMNPTYTTDGVHLNAKYVPLWTEYLKTHVTQ